MVIASKTKVNFIAGATIRQIRYVFKLFAENGPIAILLAFAYTLISCHNFACLYKY